MKLTSLDHLKNYLATTDVVVLNDIPTQRSLTSLIDSVSSSIALYCGRDFELKTITEYKQTSQTATYFPISNPPITVLTSVESDSEGLFSGGQASETNFYISADGGAICLQTPLFPNYRGLKVTYTGGLGVHAVKSVFKLTGYGIFIVGKFVKGQESGAYGKIITVAGDSITIALNYGTFDMGEKLIQMDSENTAASPSIQGTIAVFTQRALCESYPNLVMACEMEIRYLKQHRYDFENSATLKDGVTKRKMSGYTEQYFFQPEVLALIEPYKRYNLGV